MLTLTGTIAVVTGGSSGIGAATAMLLGELGADVAVGYCTNAAGADAVVEHVRGCGRRAIAIGADLRDADGARALIEGAAGALGAIDTLINNAGAFAGREAAGELPDDVIEEMLAANLKSAMRCARLVLPSMRARKSGAIVNVASIAAHTGGGEGAAAYAASKAALIAVTKALAKEAARDGVRVNAVSPGVIDTPMQRRFSSPERLERIRRDVPIGRLGTPRDCASVIAFLVSDAAAYIVGETIDVNGGLLMR